MANLSSKKALVGASWFKPVSKLATTSCARGKTKKHVSASDKSNQVPFCLMPFDLGSSFGFPEAWPPAYGSGSRGS